MGHRESTVLSFHKAIGSIAIAQDCAPPHNSSMERIQVIIGRIPVNGDFCGKARAPEGRATHEVECIPGAICWNETTGHRGRSSPGFSSLGVKSHFTLGWEFRTQREGVSE